MEESRAFAGQLSKKMITNLSQFKDLSEAQKIELEIALLSAFWAGLNYDPSVNKFEV
jgi:hypothetical protein